jgi:GDP-L-fucose synthase
MQQQARIYVAGGDTLVGAALLRQLARQGYPSLVGTPGNDPDLTSAQDVEAFFCGTRPEYVFLAAGKTGGIRANQCYPAELMRDNLLVQTHVLESAHRHAVSKLLYLASSCSYPRDTPQPMQVEALMTGPLEPTNLAYATAKIAGVVACRAYRQQYGVSFISVIPSNPFGPGEDFSLENSHVIPALIRKMHQAKQDNADSVEIWGTGTPRREFIFADDLADACIFAMQHYDEPEPLNLGTGDDLSIRQLAEEIRAVVGFGGKLCFDTSKPDGMPLKALDSSRLQALGWQGSTSFRDALAATYDWFVSHEHQL